MDEESVEMSQQQQGVLSESHGAISDMLAFLAHSKEEVRKLGRGAEEGIGRALARGGRSDEPEPRPYLALSRSPPSASAWARSPRHPLSSGWARPMSAGWPAGWPGVCSSCRPWSCWCWPSTTGRTATRRPTPAAPGPTPSWWPWRGRCGGWPTAPLSRWHRRAPALLANLDAAAVRQAVMASADWPTAAVTRRRGTGVAGGHGLGGPRPTDELSNVSWPHRDRGGRRKVDRK